VLSKADLSRADLWRARFGYADLREASLNEARLSDADLRESDLRDADLRGAQLDSANLGAAKLTNANLDGSTCVGTAVDDRDLSAARGLGSIRHLGPSTIGLDTLLKSHGLIPEVFLQGCGVPDAWIGYLPSLISSVQPIQFCSCFLSYSTKDEEFGKHLHSRM